MLTLMWLATASAGTLLMSAVDVAPGELITEIYTADIPDAVAPRAAVRSDGQVRGRRAVEFIPANTPIFLAALGTLDAEHPIEASAPEGTTVRKHRLRVPSTRIQPADRVDLVRIYAEGPCLVAADLAVLATEYMDRVSRLTSDDETVAELIYVGLDAEATQRYLVSSQRDLHVWRRPDFASTELALEPCPTEPYEPPKARAKKKPPVEYRETKSGERVYETQRTGSGEKTF